MYTFSFIFLIFLCLKFCYGLSPYPLTLIVSYDAFRHNYVSEEVTPTLAKLQKEGCSAEFLENVFVTKTFPNHASIATGLYPENHGVVGNSFYDPVYGKKLEYSYEMWHYRDDVVPIWIENERQGKGRYSGVMMWPGNEYNYSGIRPTFQQSWTESVSWKERVDTALSWFQNPLTPANLVMLYLEEPDSHGHAFGPDSKQNIQNLESMDSITKYLLNRMEKSGLRSRMNLFLVSDHGMESVTKQDIINLQPFVDDKLYDFYESSPTLHVYPKKGKVLEVYNGFMKAAKMIKGFSVYKPQDLRPDWHYSRNRRTPPILLVADPPHVFHDFYKSIDFWEKKYNFTSTNKSTFGVHGYDNKVPSMRPYFIAIGPAIKNRTKVSPFKTVDLFTVWAELLGFPNAASATNGTSAPAKQILLPHPNISLASIAAAVTGAILVIFAMVVTVYLLHRKLRNKYQVLLQHDDMTGDDSRQRLLDSEEEA